MIQTVSQIVEKHAREVASNSRILSTSCVLRRRDRRMCRSVRSLAAGPQDVKAVRESWLVSVDHSRRLSGKVGALLTDTRLLIRNRREAPQSIQLADLRSVHLSEGVRPILCVNHTLILETPLRAVEAGKATIWLAEVLREFVSARSPEKGSAKTETPVNPSTLYSSLTDLAIQSEQVRWTRLNNWLFVSSILVLSWVTVLAMDPGTINGSARSIVLIGLSLPGTLLGPLWGLLGARSSRYIDRFHQIGASIEAEFAVGQPMCFVGVRAMREGAGRFPRLFTSSTWIVKWTPIILGLVSCGMLLLSAFFL